MFCWRPLKANKFVGCCKLFINIYIRFQVSIFGQAVTYLVYFYNSLAIDIYYFFGKKYHVWFFTSTKIVAKQTCQKSSIAFFLVLNYQFVQSESEMKSLSPSKLLVARKTTTWFHFFSFEKVLSYIFSHKSYHFQIMYFSGMMGSTKNFTIEQSKTNFTYMILLR